jgi:uncharacterized protein YdaU (DUF1376 family)
MLLCAQWESNSPLPNDLGRLARIAGLELAEFELVWPVVSTKFTETGIGHVNPKMLEHLTNYLRYREKQREGGRHGAEKRWGKRERPAAGGKGFQP